MENQKRGRLVSWMHFLNALSSFASRLIWVVIAIIILAALGRFLYFESQDAVSGRTDQPTELPTEVPILEPVPWYEVNKDIVATLRKSSAAAESYASVECGLLTAELQQRIDDDFLDWYFGYWQQQMLGLKSMAYWISEKLFSEQPSMAERITEEIQGEFAKRVLRPQILQLQIERIAGATVQIFIQELSGNLRTIPEKYNIPRADWDRYLNDIALTTADVEGNREVSVSLKTIVSSGVAGGVKVVTMLEPMIAKIGTKMATEAAVEGAGKAATKVAANTAAKTGAKIGTKLLGPIVGVGVIVWDVWDHRHTKKINKPILRQNLADYLVELQYSLLHEPETGLMSIVHRLEANVISGLKTQG